MSLQNVGLGGVLTFDDRQAISGMKRAGMAAVGFQKQFQGIVSAAKNVGRGFGQLGGAARGAGVAMAPATLAMGHGVKTAAEFEHQMQAVAAVSGATPEQMKLLTAEAKKMGLTTSYGAIEAGQGLEYLARAGFTPIEQMNALAPAIHAATIEGIDLGKVTDIMSNTLRGMGLEGTNAGHVADVLAVASAKTNTSITGMGEALKYSVGQAKTMGIELDTLAAALGIAADAGLRGSIGGTSFTQSLVKLAKPSELGAEYLENMGVKMTKTAKGGLDMVDVFRQIHTGVQKITDPVKRAAYVTEIFGVRGQKMFSAFETAFDTKNPEKTVESLLESLQKADGEAKRMAEKRTNTFLGQLKMLSAAWSSFEIEAFEPMLAPLTANLKELLKFGRGFVQIMQELNTETGLTKETSDKYGSTMVAVASGIKAGFDTAIEAYQKMRTKIIEFMKEFTGGQSPEMIKEFTKIATIMFIVAAAVGPILLALGGMAFVISTVVVPAIEGIGAIIGGLFSWPILAAIALVVGGFMMFREEGETVGETFTRIVDGIVEGFNWVMDTAIHPFIAGWEWVRETFDVVFTFIWGKITDFAESVRNDFMDLFGGIISALQELAPFFKVVFTLIGNIVGVAAGIIGVAFAGVLSLVKNIFHEVKHIILSVVESVVNFIKGISYGLGVVADLIGMDVGKQMMEFGAKDWNIHVGTDERGLKGPKEREDVVLDSNERDTMVVDLAALNAQSTAAAVGDAVADAMPDELNVESKVCVDGKTIARATGKHKQELSERAGFKATPWARRARAEHGAVPARGD